MNILILNASPKRKGGASRCFSRLMNLMLLGCKVTTCDVRGPGDYKNALSLLENVDAVVISSPLYVDGIPAHMLPFLIQAEQLCVEKRRCFKLYVLSNSGFIEAKQNALHLKMYEAWCSRAGIEWGGGLGIGGGVMLYVLYILFPISVIIRFAQVLLAIIQTGGISGADIWAYCSGLLVTPFFFILPFVCMAVMAFTIRNKKSHTNIFTRPLIPSFLFLIAADIFMLLSAILKGTLPHKLFKRVSVDEEDGMLKRNR